MSRGPVFVVLWWRLAGLPRLAFDALRRDRPFRLAAAGAIVALALWLGRPPPALVPPEILPEAAPAALEAIPPPAAPSPLPGPPGPPGTAAAPSLPPIAPSVPLGPAPAAPRDTFGTVPAPRAPAP